MALCADLDVDYKSLNPGVKPKIYVIDPVPKQEKGNFHKKVQNFNNKILVVSSNLDQVSNESESTVEMEEVEPLKNEEVAPSKDEETVSVVDPDMPRLENEDEDQPVPFSVSQPRPIRNFGTPSDNSGSESSSSHSPPTSTSSSSNDEVDETLDSLIPCMQEERDIELNSNFVQAVDFEPESGYETFDSAANVSLN